MNRFERWFLKRLLTKQVRHSTWYLYNIRELYGMIRRAAEDEFVEDNQITIDDTLRRLFESTQRIDRYKFPAPHTITPLPDDEADQLTFVP